MVRMMISTLILASSDAACCDMERSLSSTSAMMSYCRPATNSVLPATMFHISVSMAGLM